MLKGLDGLHDKFHEWKTAYCWIEGRDIPPVESLQLGCGPNDREGIRRAISTWVESSVSRFLDWLMA